MNIFDVLAIIPFFVILIIQQTEGNCESAKKSGSFVFIRVLRVFRIFKLSKHSQVTLALLGAGYCGWGGASCSGGWMGWVFSVLRCRCRKEITRFSINLFMIILCDEHVFFRHCSGSDYELTMLEFNGETSLTFNSKREWLHGVTYTVYTVPLIPLRS